MAKNKYTVVWKPDCEVNTYVTWIELDFNVHQYIESSLWKEMMQTLVAEEDLEDYLPFGTDMDEWIGVVHAVFEGHLDCKWSNM